MVGYSSKEHGIADREIQEDPFEIQRSLVLQQYYLAFPPQEGQIMHFSIQSDEAGVGVEVTVGVGVGVEVGVGVGVGFGVGVEV